MALPFDPHEFPVSLFGLCKNGLPLAKHSPLDEDEVRQESQKLSKQLFDDWHVLHGIIQRHENTITRRWLKKTNKQRTAILMEAWPNMQQSHRPDLEAFKNYNRARNEKAESSILEAYKWPCINLEDLLKPKTLLLFLNSRARNFPGIFRHGDLEMTTLGQQVLRIKVGELPNYTMEFHNRNTHQTYGELVCSKPAQKLEADQGLETSHIEDEILAHPGYGLLLLEVQQRLWRFLVLCATKILHDIPEDTLMDFEIQPEPSSLVASDHGFNQAMVTLAMEAPYRVPARLDLRRLKSIILAKKSAAEDHIGGLREDPGYFNDVMMELHEHQPEMRWDSHFRRYLSFQPRLEEKFWARILAQAIQRAYLWALVWEKLHEQIAELIAFEEKHRNAISPEKELPQAYSRALQKFRIFLLQSTEFPLACLDNGVPSSPPMRNYWEQEPYESGGPSPEFYLKELSNKDKIRDRLLSIFNTLLSRKHEIFADLHTFIDELERLTQNEPKAKEMQSAWVAAVVSDLSVVTECLHQLGLYHPWSRSISKNMEAHRKELRAEFLKETSDWRGLLAVDWDVGSGLARLGMPSRGRFAYPAHKRKTRENTKVLITAERNLDAFWLAVDNRYQTSEFGRPLSDLTKKLFAGRVLQRTPEWVEPVAITERRPKDCPLREALETPFSESHHDPEYQSGRNFYQSLPLRSKDKTRSIIETSEIDSTPEALAEQPEELPKYFVDRRAKKVFSTIFFMPSQSDFTGEIAWADFLHAMQSAGFVAQKLYGSVWQFSPVDLDLERSIQFHEPHPSGKIPFQIARRHGRRLNRAYGWHGGMFELQ